MQTARMNDAQHPDVRYPPRMMVGEMLPRSPDLTACIMARSVAEIPDCDPPIVAKRCKEGLAKDVLKKMAAGCHDGLLL